MVALSGGMWHMATPAFAARRRWTRWSTSGVIPFGGHVANCDHHICCAQVLDALAIVVLCPGAVFALAAGAIFSLAQGTALVWLGTSLGQTLAFMVGRCARRAGSQGVRCQRGSAEDCEIGVRRRQDSTDVTVPPGVGRDIVIVVQGKQLDVPLRICEL